MRAAALLALVCLVLMLSGVAHAQPRPTPPGPPATGAGSVDYLHAGVTVSGTSGIPGGFVLYEPADPAPATAPVVIYLHGAQAVDTRDLNDAQLRHLARRGNVVVYAEEGTVDVAGYQDAARRAIGSALAELARPGHVRPDAGFGFVGHSIGGLVALSLAANPGDLPRPSVVVAHDPAGLDYAAFTGIDASMATLAGLDPATRLLVIEAATTADTSNGAADAIWRNAPTPRAERNWLRVPSDDRGTPPLVSDHSGSLAGDVFLGSRSPLDAIDWWGYWRPTDAALAEGFGETAAGFAFCSAAGPTCDPVRDMGSWSDGTPVARIANAADLGG